jgi:micrococcal nuclease
MTRRNAFLYGGLVFLAIAVFVLGIQAVFSRNGPLMSLDWQERFLSIGKKDTLPGSAVVRRVVDGDTIELENGERIRYIGMDTPESVKPGVLVQCFAKEAAAFNRGLVEGKTVRLERDVSDRDKYGRLLRYVYLDDGTFVNEVLVQEGYAYAVSYPPDVVKQDVFRAAERAARDTKRGLWNEATCNGKR